MVTDVCLSGKYERINEKTISVVQIDKTVLLGMNYQEWCREIEIDVIFFISNNFSLINYIDEFEKFVKQTQNLKYLRIFSNIEAI